jgi:hypothetical protein
MWIYVPPVLLRVSAVCVRVTDAAVYCPLDYVSCSSLFVVHTTPFNYCSDVSQAQLRDQHVFCNH